MRTARSRISGEYLLDLFITQSSQEMEPPTNPGRFSLVEGLGRAPNVVGTRVSDIRYRPR